MSNCWPIRKNKGKIKQEAVLEDRLDDNKIIKHQNSFTSEKHTTTTHTREISTTTIVSSSNNGYIRPLHELQKSIAVDATPFSVRPARSAFTSVPLTTNSATPRQQATNRSPYNALYLNRTNGGNRSNVVAGRKSDELRQKLIVKVVKSSMFYDDPKKTKVPTYVTHAKYRGRLLLINNIKFVDAKQVRIGAELDEANIVALFSQMGFEIVKYRNLDYNDMRKKVKDFRSSSALQKVDIGTVIVMSHGRGSESSDSTEVVCTDGKLLKTSWIINEFDVTTCPALSGKPKIFIFQCCRGDNRDIQYDSVPITSPRKLSDMLIAYSTIPGFVSHRNPEHGTWYIQAICSVFMEHAHDTDVENLLKIVDSVLSNLITPEGSKQTSSFENRGFKTCYLHPK